MLDRPVYDLDVERTHNFVAERPRHAQLDLRFRGADIRNVLEFERDFPDAQTIPLEQNYRSTQTRSSTRRTASSRTTASARRRTSGRSSARASPSASIEVEDEHAEARFVAAEIAALVEEGYSGSEIAVFYRMNAQSRVLEDILVRQGVAYQVIGGPRFYERAEMKDLVAYLQVLDNPYDAVSLLRIANRPRRGIGDSSLARLQTWADQRGDLALGGDGRGRDGRRRRRAAEGAQGVPRDDRVAHVGARRSTRSPELIEEVLARSGYIESLEAERTIEAQGRMENLAGARRASRASGASRPRDRRSRRSSRRSRSTPTRTRSAATARSSR